MRALSLFIACLGVVLAVGTSAVAKSRAPRPKHKAHQVKGLSLKVKAWFKKERRGDGSPTIHYRFILRNHTPKTIYLSMYGKPIRAVELKPRSAFRIRKLQRRPHRMRPPYRSDIVKIKPRSKKTLKDWQWSSSFSLDNKDPSFMDYYVLKKPTRITMRFCLFGRSLTSMKSFLPKGAVFWTGKLCAKPVRVRITRLPSSP